MSWRATDLNKCIKYPLKLNELIVKEFPTLAKADRVNPLPFVFPPNNRMFFLELEIRDYWHIVPSVTKDYREYYCFHLLYRYIRQINVKFFLTLSTLNAFLCFYWTKINYLFTFLIIDWIDTKSGLSLGSSDQHFLIIARISSSAIFSSSNGLKPSSQTLPIISLCEE